ncbi:hypothetical protein [Candidatus Thioglobus sp.]|uniref:hypothetical protein n=1 Tax=Candidatus Thioglobus sp. TaxID=2026721 RepID=UPI003D1209C2
MIFLQLKIDNFYMFKDAFIDFTYPKKIKNSTIEGEYLTEFPKIKYKKVCIFMAANASGKTSLGRIMCAINNYLAGRPVEEVPSKIYNKDKNSSLEVTYVTPDTKEIHQLKAKFNKIGLIFESYQSCKLKKTLSLNDTLAEVNASKPKFKYDKNNNYDITNPGFQSIAFLKGYKPHGNIRAWHYMFSESNSSTELNTNINISLLEKILKSFDSSIVKIVKVSGNDKAYTIHFSNGDNVIVEDGKVLNSERLSRGTFEALEVSEFVYSVMNRNNATLFLDEKMAYSHSEIEISMLNLMIEKLKENSQLFYTSHNYDILEMNLPSHSYIFMRKDKFVEVIHPEKLGYTKNDRNLLGFVKNDVFRTLPDTTRIEELL